MLWFQLQVSAKRTDIWVLCLLFVSTNKLFDVVKLLGESFRLVTVLFFPCICWVFIIMVLLIDVRVVYKDGA